MENGEMENGLPEKRRCSLLPSRTPFRLIELFVVAMRESPYQNPTLVMETRE